MWQDIQGHDTIIERFRRAFHRGRLAGSFLFVGPGGVGKRRFAFVLAKGLLCKKQDNLNPCGACDSCKLFGETGCTEIDFTAEEFLSPHPDLFYVAKPEDKSSLPMELLVGDKEHRGHAGLCYHISRTPYWGNRKVAILNDVDFLNNEGANALLKTLEEPPPDAVLILVGTSTAKLLPTIRSRCQMVRFSPLPPEMVSEILVKKGIVSSLEQGKRCACRSEGSLDLAREWADGDVDTLRKELTTYFTAPHCDAVGLAAKVNGILESLGKDPPLRRRQLQMVFRLALDHFRGEMCGEDSKRAVRRLERTLDAVEHVSQNALLPLVIEAWAVSLR